MEERTKEFLKCLGNGKSLAEIEVEEDEMDFTWNSGKNNFNLNTFKKKG